MKTSWRSLALAGLLGASSTMHAYIVSAVLEYSVDDRAAFYLNGHQILKDSGIKYTDYAVLSTSDGTLPAEYFLPNGENVLAVENYDTGGGVMGISFRLTVTHSSGDPVVIWGMPDETRFLHMTKGQAMPAGWTELKYDDSAWLRAIEVPPSKSDWPKLPEKMLGGLGAQGYVPWVAHSASGGSNPGDRNLFRSRFTFPYQAGKTRLLVSPTTANVGQTLAMRLVPPGDAADIGAFKIYADLPAGISLLQAPGAGFVDASKNRVGWSFKGLGQAVKYVVLPLDQVLEDGGWANVKRALGPAKPNKPSGYLASNANPPDAAAFLPGASTWFKVQAPPAEVMSAYPGVLGVIFHSQMMVPATNHGTRQDIDRIHFNYSVRSDRAPALQEERWIGRVSQPFAWFDGFSDMTSDRTWTWADVQRLAIRIGADARLKPDRNNMASGWVVVRCVRPNDTAPLFYAKVNEPQCKSLKVETGIWSPRFAAAAADSVVVAVNQSRCPTATPVPTPAMVIPGETPVPTVKPTSSVRAGIEKFGLGCLASSPEPFNYAGVFVKFCLKANAKVQLKVYSGRTLVRTLDGGDFRPGDNQIFFNALDDAGKMLPAGAYTYEVYATDGEDSAAKSSTFNRRSDKRR